MSSVSPSAFPTRRTVGLTLGFVLIVALAMVTYSTTEALEEREVASAVFELHAAANEIAHADTVRSLGGDPDLVEVTKALDTLDRRRDAAIHALDQQQMGRLDRLIGELRVNAGSLLGDIDVERVEGHDHSELHELLEVTTATAASKAERSERNAAAAIAVAALALALAGNLVTRSRRLTARAQSQAETEIREGQRLQRLLDDSPDVLFVIGPEGRITFRSRAANGLLARAATNVDDVVGLAAPEDRSTLLDHLTDVGPDRASEVFRLRSRGGHRGWFDISVSDLTGDELVDGLLVTAREITTEVELRGELERQAVTDALTGLPNRRGLDPAIEAARMLMEESGHPMALLALDIDRFKEINDTLGHPIGDQLLVALTARLSNVIRSDATLLRMGGDEFAVVLPTVSGADEALRIAQRLLDALDKPFRLGDRVESVTTSAGLALADKPEDADDLIIRSDLALYEAKRRSGTSVEMYDVALESTITWGNQLARALREAVHDEELALVYQPIVTVATQEVVGLEALLRWTSPHVGSVGPDEFIPVAESTGEIRALGHWVLNEACRQMAVWIEAGLVPGITVSVNVSARQLADAAFVDSVLEAAARWNVPTERLVIEITETAALDHTGLARRRIEELKAAGFKISIDDFGSGYSNLGQLISVPFDIIKIDRSLLITLSTMREQAGGDATEPCAIMQAIVSIASILDAPVVCEGVETEQQFLSLQASGITHLQGYLIGRPSPPEIVTESLTSGGLIVDSRVTSTHS